MNFNNINNDLKYIAIYDYSEKAKVLYAESISGSIISDSIAESIKLIEKYQEYKEIDLLHNDTVIPLYLNSDIKQAIITFDLDRQKVR